MDYHYVLTLQVEPLLLNSTPHVRSFTGILTDMEVDTREAALSEAESRAMVELFGEDAWSPGIPDTSVVFWSIERNSLEA